MARKRTIKPSKGKSFRGKTIFLKTRKAVHWESTLERDFVRLADYDPQILDIEHQPFCLEYYFRGKRGTYNPDYKLVLFGHLIIIVEVKPYGKINDERNLVKFEVGRQYCYEMGWEYRVMTERQIRPGYFQDNLKMLRSLGNEITPGVYVQFVFSKLQQLGECPIYELKENCSELKEESSFYAALYKLLYFQKIDADLVNQKLNDATVVSFRSGN